MGTSIPVREDVRDTLADDKPDGVSWSDYLEALHDGADLGGNGDAVDVDAEAIADELVAKLDMTADPGVVMEESDVAELVSDVRRLQELMEKAPGRTADELEGRFA